MLCFLTYSRNLLNGQEAEYRPLKGIKSQSLGCVNITLKENVTEDVIQLKLWI